MTAWTGLVVVLALAGCGRLRFDATNDAATSEGSGDAMPDSVDARPLGPTCPGDPSLLACYSFDSTLIDSTGRGNDATGVDVTFVPGIEGMAAQFESTSRADVTPNLDASAITIDAWVNREALASDGLVFDHDARWAMGFTSEGQLLCSLTPIILAKSATIVPEGVWTHIACTFAADSVDGYIAGVDVVTDGGGVVTAGNTEAAIGGDAPAGQTGKPFVGAIDRMRIWSRALSATEVCDAAGC
ncbi:hypothetical protein BH11MYX2_BH11MYX2_27850 [soil metagenome]